jgi:hypothetical protein
VRVIGILESLIKNHCSITFVSASKKSKLEASDIQQYAQISSLFCNPNDERDINKVFQNLKGVPDVAIFDTFVAEEMFRFIFFNR